MHNHLHFIYSGIEPFVQDYVYKAMYEFPINFTDLKRREQVHELILKHFRSREAFQNLYKSLKLQPLPETLPDLAGIDLWLLTRPFSWRQLAWNLYRCNIPRAVIEIEQFIEGE